MDTLQDKIIENKHYVWLNTKDNEIPVPSKDKSALPEFNGYVSVCGTADVVGIADGGGMHVATEAIMPA